MESFFFLLFLFDNINYVKLAFAELLLYIIRVIEQL